MNALPVEHVAWQVRDPVAITNWYVTHLGFRILRTTDAPTFTHFMEDASGRVVVEIYNNPAASLPDYFAMHALHLHLAFESQDPEADRDRLMKAGATVSEDLTVTSAGDRLVMLRDPFGFSIQLCQRKQQMQVR